MYCQYDSEYQSPTLKCFESVHDAKTTIKRKISESQFSKKINQHVNEH